ncbi:MAG: type V CRISPR-associated protein Cas12k [Xenococcaceae cyanobacterium MO_167.B52]|nr:type V CRISPR-associated protein Cas12k [Xenococcaceae cyanobacterium MO_167.B52]
MDRVLVEYIYKSWLKLQQRLIFQLRGQERWLTMLKSDEELITECDCSLEQIQNKAKRIINNLGSDREQNTSSQLFNLYDSTQDIFNQYAIAYLLKNGCRIPKKPENAKKFTNRRRKAEIKVNRLIKKLNGKAPQGRDLTGQKWLDMLLTATTKVPKDEAEAKSWQDALLTKAKSVPYPIAYESNEDITWIKNDRGRLCVKFNGLGEFTFEIYCNKRQLTIFQRFYEDQQIKKASKNNHSSALFTLRSARIAWQEGKGKDKDKPWNINRLILFCTFDTL